MLSDGLLRVFWPNNIPKSTSPGVIVGWRNSEFDLFVLTVFEHVEVRPVHPCYVRQVSDELSLLC